MEKHGEGEQEHDRTAPDEVLARERVGHDHGHCDVVDGAEHGVEDRIAVAEPDVPVLEHRLVAVQVGLYRQQPHASGQHLLGVAERRTDDVDERVDDDDEREGEQRVVEGVEDAVLAGVLDSRPARRRRWRGIRWRRRHRGRQVGAGPPYHRLVSDTRRENRFTPTSRKNAITLRNRLIAAAYEKLGVAEARPIL